MLCIERFDLIWVWLENFLAAHIVFRDHVFFGIFDYRDQITRLDQEFLA